MLAILPPTISTQMGEGQKRADGGLKPRWIVEFWGAGVWGQSQNFARTDGDGTRGEMLALGVESGNELCVCVCVCIGRAQNPLRNSGERSE